MVSSVAESRAGGKALRLAGFTFALLFASNFMNFVDRQVIASLAPILKEAWSLSDSKLGLLATAFEVAYALAHLPIAALSDRWLRRGVIALAILVWSGAMAVSGAAPSFWALLLGRGLLGLGQAGYGPSALAWLSDVFPPSYRSRIIGLHDLAPLLGSAAGYGLGGVLGRRLGWRPVFCLAALPGFLLATLVWRLSEPQKGQSDYLALGARVRQLSRRARAQLPMHGLLRTPTLLATYGTGTLLAFALGGLSYWIPTFGVRSHGFTESQMGLIIGGVTLVSGAAGVLSGGILADRLASRFPAARLLLIGASAILGSALSLAVILVPSRTAFVGLAAVAIYAFAFYAPCMGPLVHQVTHPSLRATAVALYLLIIHVLGYALAPAVVGWLSDRMGDLRLGMSLAAVASLLGGLLGLWGTRFVARDSRTLIQRLQVEVSRTFEPTS